MKLTFAVMATLAGLAVAAYTPADITARGPPSVCFLCRNCKGATLSKCQSKCQQCRSSPCLDDRNCYVRCTGEVKSISQSC